MSDGIRNGYLVLADISGYTSFFAESELDHAQAIMREILDQVIRNLTPMLSLCEVEGDAVFVYADDARLPRGETVLELIESTYVAFRDAQRSRQRMATCECNACRSIPDLDLKFITHHGEYVLQSYGGKMKPVGSSVNLAHRLMKNGVSEATGWRGYALFSEPALRAIGIPSTGMHASEEVYEHLGTVATWTLDMDSRFRTLTEQRCIRISSDEAHLNHVKEIDAPVAMVWEWLNDPERRLDWWTGSGWGMKERREGRTAPGAMNHCSESKFTELVLDWHPFRYYTVVRSRSILKLYETVDLEPTEGGTRVHWHHKLHGSLPLPLMRPLCRLAVMKGMQLPTIIENLARTLTDHARKTERLSNGVSTEAAV